MCTCPITIIYQDECGQHAMNVPCGKCEECLKTKQNDYMVRIYEELMQVSKACFLTLTYAPKNVPYIIRGEKKYNVVWKQDVKDWIKRFRTNFERKTGKKGVRFFLCSEYGPKTCRPHYHVIFFGLDHIDLSMAIQDWQLNFGFVLSKDIDQDVASKERASRYVAKYSCKGMFEHPFCCKAQPSDFLSSILQTSWYDLYKKNEELSPLFYLYGEVSDYQDWTYVPYSWKVPWFQPFVFGRGVEAKVCCS